MLENKAGAGEHTWKWRIVLELETIPGAGK
jgi:hypothetical protein